MLSNDEKHKRFVVLSREYSKKRIEMYDLVKQGKISYKRKDRYTPKQRREKVIEWLDFFPEMGFDKNRMIARLVGPFIIGFYFKTNNTIGAGLCADFITANLATFDFEEKESFTLCKFEQGHTIKHDWPRELLEAWVEKFRLRFPIKTEGFITLDEILNIYFTKTNYVSSTRLFDPTLICIWAGEIERAEKYFEKALEKQKRYQEAAKGYPDYFKGWELTNEPVEKIRYFMDNPEELRKIYIHNIKNKKLDMLPYQDLDVPYKEEWFKQRDLDNKAKVKK